MKIHGRLIIEVVDAFRAISKYQRNETSVVHKWVDWL